MTTKKTSFWNGKNMAGEDYVGVKGLISEGARTSPTESKYQVSNDTIAAADLQTAGKSPEKGNKKGG